MKNVGSAIVITALLSACQSVGPRNSTAFERPFSCARTAGTAIDVEQAIKAFYVSLAKDDRQSFNALTTENFYAFEVGKRYSGPQLFGLIAEAHNAGRAFEWNIGAVETHVDCDLASAVWENHGASGIPGKMEPRAWLESAVLVRHGDRWVITFFHSTPKDPRP